MIILRICFYQNSPQYPSFIQENFDLVENTDRTMLISKEMPYIDNICDGDTVEGCQDPEWKDFQSGSISKRSPCPCRQRYDVETGYPKKGFKIDVGDSERIEMRAGLGASTVGMSVIVNSGTSKGCGSSGRIGSSSSANEGRFPP